MVMQLLEQHIQERLGAALHTLATIEQRAAGAPDPRGIQNLLKLFRQLVSDLENCYKRLKEAAAQQDVIQRRLETASKRADLLFDSSPTPCVVVEESGRISDANPAAARLLNTSLRHLPGKSFELFLARDRSGFFAWLQRVAHGEQVDPWAGALRPREQRTRQITLTGTPETAGQIALVLTVTDAREATVLDAGLEAVDVLA
jgi:PAS domain-containing protein